MNHEHELSHAQSAAHAVANTRDHDLAPGQSSHSAKLSKSDHAAASGLVQTYKPPKAGVATTTALLRSLPSASPCTTLLKTLVSGAVVAVHSEVQSTDAANPRWFAVEVDKLNGYVTVPVVRMEEQHKETEASGTKADDALFSGHLATMRSKGEFLQRCPGLGRTLYQASERALKTLARKKGEAELKKWDPSHETIEGKAKSFQDDACNILTLFFIEQASKLRSETQTRTYNEYAKFVENEMADYFAHALCNELLDKKWNVSNTLANKSVSLDEGCEASHSPYEKAVRLRRCEGRLIRIHTSDHYFLGRVKNGILQAHDHQYTKPTSNIKHVQERVGEFDLKNILQDTNTGKPYDYLKNILIFAHPEKTAALAEEDESNSDVGLTHTTGKQTESSGTQPGADPDSTQAGGGPVPVQAPSANPDAWLFSGHLARMRREGEFIQRGAEAEKGTLHRACTRTFEKRGYSGKALAAKAKSFRDDACNIIALFFIERAEDLRAQAELPQVSYPAYKERVEDLMGTYFLDALNSKLVREDAYVNSNAALDTGEGCSAGDTPYAKAQGLLKCEGRLIRIHTSGHYFVGEVKGGILHADDNQGDGRNRSGEFDLKEVTPETKAGKTYLYLKNTLVSASPAKGCAPKSDAGKQAESSGAQPNTAPSSMQVGGGLTPEVEAPAAHVATGSQTGCTPSKAPAIHDKHEDGQLPSEPALQRFFREHNDLAIPGLCSEAERRLAGAYFPGTVGNAASFIRTQAKDQRGELEGRLRHLQEGWTSASRVQGAQSVLKQLWRPWHKDWEKSAHGPVQRKEGTNELPGAESWKQKIARWVASGAESAHEVYGYFADLAAEYPWAQSLVNVQVRLAKAAAGSLVDTSPASVSWIGLGAMWLFELGDNPLNIGDGAVTTRDLQGQEGVQRVRDLAREEARKGTLTKVKKTWTYGQKEFYDGLKQGNLATSFLGSYQTQVSLSSQTADSVTLHFEATNPTSWESGTRLRKAAKPGGVHQGVIPSRKRDSGGIELGGDHTQIWRWSETLPRQ